MNEKKHLLNALYVQSTVLELETQVGKSAPAPEAFLLEWGRPHPWEVLAVSQMERSHGPQGTAVKQMWSGHLSWHIHIEVRSISDGRMSDGARDFWGENPLSQFSGTRGSELHETSVTAPLWNPWSVDISLCLELSCRMA